MSFDSPDWVSTISPGNANIYSSGSVIVANSATLSTPVLNVAGFTQMLLKLNQLNTGLSDVSISWFTDPAGSNPINFGGGWIKDTSPFSYVVQKVLGPYFQLNYRNDSGANNTFSIIVTGTTSPMPLHAWEAGGVYDPLYVAAISVGAGASVDEFPSSALSGRAHLWANVNGSAATQSVRVQFRDINGWHFLAGVFNSATAPQDLNTDLALPASDWKVTFTNGDSVTRVFYAAVAMDSET